MAVGAASPTAQGQAMTMTARANMNEKRAGPARIDRGQPAGAFEKRRDALLMLMLILRRLLQNVYEASLPPTS